MSIQLIASRCDEALKRVCALAMTDAARLYHPSVGSEHFLGAIMGDEHNEGAKALAQMGITRVGTLAQLLLLEIPCKKIPLPLPLAPFMEKVFAWMVSEAEAVKSRHIGVEHLLLAMTREPECAAMLMLHAMGAPAEMVRAKIKARWN